MLRKSVLAGLTLALCVGLSCADEMRGTITKVDGNKVTFTPQKKKKDTQTPEVQTLTAADAVKVSKGTVNKQAKKVEAGDAIENGLKNALFTGISAKGVRTVIVTDSDKKITEITVIGKKKKQ